MAHYAELDNNNQVLRVVVIDNAKEATEAEGIAFCKNLLGGNNWRKTSYNSNIRKNFASPGYVYDQFRDAFIPPRPYPSWGLNEVTCQWEAPVAPPESEVPLFWDEITQTWKS
ncbi:hypothetical protein UFOVP635_14 [uncultured Caudovirales phage]|uniref:Uncharacterized protein n=1 Tax=uncultured Caudovirales phage TaxID=2100421 RepID=A0A6J5N6G8_9CAUD|nr:hypothetical protein UFOVP635_14 [uncultured Caudovirales phage]